MKNFSLNVAAVLGSTLLFNVIMFLVLSMPVSYSSMERPLMWFFFLLMVATPAFYQWWSFAPERSVICCAVSAVILLGNFMGLAIMCIFRAPDCSSRGPENLYEMLKMFVKSAPFTLVPMVVLFVLIRFISSCFKARMPV
ncbi:MAG: hypothetical protein ACAI35_18505 [Candidatus Methylacidiphilales bacterium]